jgi:transcriptional regulator with XRE-family HTH domain
VSTGFRNLDFDPSAPVDEWPAEAIETIMDRGSLSDWRRLAAAVRRSPWGKVARTVETIASWGEHYGVDALMIEVIRQARDEVNLRGRLRYAQKIRAWRAGTGMSLREFASAAGTSASRLSDYENGKVAPTTDVLGRLRYVASVATRPGEPRAPLANPPVAPRAAPPGPYRTPRANSSRLSSGGPPAERTDTSPKPNSSSSARSERRV